MLVTSTFRAGVLTACLATFGCIEPASPEPEPDPTAEAVAVVSGFIGRDLKEASDDDLKPLCQALRILDPSRQDDKSSFERRPQHIWPYGRDDGPSGFLVQDADRWGSHPGSTRIRLTAFDAVGNVRAQAEFTTGWRRYLKEARSVQIGDLREPAVALECIENLGPDTGRDYYAMVGNRFDLVRIERSDGTTGRNGYYVYHSARGPLPLVQSAAEWEADLCSDDRPRVLRTLVWLGGHHGPVRTGKEAADRQYESADEVRLVWEVRARAGIIARLRVLVESDDEWVREAAKLAAQPDDAKW